MKAIVIKIVSIMLISASSAVAQNKIDIFIMDYPHGEYRIHVKRTGEAYLYYGAGAAAQIIKKDTFSVENLYRLFKQYLHPNLPRAQWPDPKSQFGMVTIRYADGKEENYLIFDLQEIAEDVFKKAKRNMARKIF